MKEMNIKKAPTGGTVKGEILNISLSYQNEVGLSTAAQILLLIVQAQEPADCLQKTCWERLDHVLRQYYTNNVCNVARELIPDMDGAE